MVRFCEQYYKMNIGGEDKVVLHRYSQITSKWYMLDGTEYTDESSLSEIEAQAIKENEINDGMLYELAKNAGDSEYSKLMIGELPIPEEFKSNSSTVAYFLPILEQSFIDDLGEPSYVDGNPYSESNKYVIGNSYIALAAFDENLNFFYALFSTLLTNCGYIASGVMSWMETAENKMNEMSEKITALENKLNEGNT